MSYRSFKRVLGETSLERKCRYLFGGCLLLLIAGSFWFYGQQTEKLVFKQNRERGRLLVDFIVYQAHIPVLYPFSKENVKQDLESLAPHLQPQLQNLKYRWDFIHPLDPASEPPASAAEREIIERLLVSRRPAEDSGEFPTPSEDLLDGTNYRYYQAMVVQEHVCLTCHPTVAGANTQRLDVGDVYRVARIEIPYKEALGDLNWNRAILIATAIITGFLAMIASYIIVRYVIVKPLKHLRDVSDAISHGNIELRAEIRTADEFEELGVAFNRMLRHLVAAQEELRQVNGSLDAKVDELAQVNMRLFELNRLKSDFLATMSHELRTPLNSIIGFSEVLGSISTLNDKQKRYVQNIQTSGKMLLDMINDILDLAKIESGKMEIRLSNFRIEHVIAAQCDMARPLSEKKNIDLDAEIEPNLPELHQDQGKVQQVLNNLLSNAIKFTPEGGRICVAARRGEADDVLLIVSDTGVGIADEDQVQVFEKFRQGHTVLPAGDAMTREYSGTGLGLSIVKEMCKLLGGEVTLTSDLGKGSTFTVRLPRWLEDQPPLDSPLSVPWTAWPDRAALTSG